MMAELWTDVKSLFVKSEGPGGDGDRLRCAGRVMKAAFWVYGVLRAATMLWQFLSIFSLLFKSREIAFLDGMWSFFSAVFWSLAEAGVAVVFIVLAEPARRFCYALADLLEAKKNDAEEKKDEPETKEDEPPVELWVDPSEGSKSE